MRGNAYPRIHVAQVSYTTSRFVLPSSFRSVHQALSTATCLARFSGAPAELSAISAGMVS
jgi:hypothetical protein